MPTFMYMFMLFVLVWGVAARTTRLITRDSIMENLRARWVVHFEGRRRRILDEALAYLPADHRYTSPELEEEEAREGVALAVSERAAREVPVRFWERRGTWRRYENRLVWTQAWEEFITCPWCVGFWVHAGAWLFTWMTVPQLAGVVAGLPVWFALPALIMLSSWLYGTVASASAG